MTTIIEDEDVLHLLTGRTPLNINRLLTYFLKETNVSLTREQWSVMAVLWKNDGATQQMLANATYRDRPGITRLLDNLEKEEYIQRRPHATDRRTNLIFLTKKGKAAQKPVVKALNETVEVATQKISSQELNMLRKVFNQINNNIREMAISQKA